MHKYKVVSNKSESLSDDVRCFKWTPKVTPDVNSGHQQIIFKLLFSLHKIASLLVPFGDFTNHASPKGEGFTPSLKGTLKAA